MKPFYFSSRSKIPSDAEFISASSDLISHFGLGETYAKYSSQGEVGPNFDAYLTDIPGMKKNPKKNIHSRENRRFCRQEAQGFPVWSSTCGCSKETIHNC
jgi:hypothetical protein